jgi:uncharacterized protein (DUF58 family)
VAHLDPNSIAALGDLQLKARHIVQSALSGLHRARLHGSSVEFAEHKEYSPGDEIRHIDWKAYAKVDRYYVKQYEQESQLTAQLMLDASASMGFAGDGSSKLSYAAHLLASLVYLFIRQRDRVGLSVFGAGEGEYSLVPPRSRPTHAHDLYHALEAVLERGARGRQGAGQAIARLAEMADRRRSLVILCSDLLSADSQDDDAGAAIEGLRLLHARGHETVVFHVLDPHELELPYSGLTRFRSLEDERDVLVEPEHVRKRYLEALRAFLQRVRDTCMDAGVEYHLVSTATPIEQTLIDFASARMRLSQPRSTWSF